MSKDSKVGESESIIDRTSTIISMSLVDCDQQLTTKDDGRHWAEGEGGEEERRGGASELQRSVCSSRAMESN